MRSYRYNFFLLFKIKLINKNCILFVLKFLFYLINLTFQIFFLKFLLKYLFKKKWTAFNFIWGRLPLKELLDNFTDAMKYALNFFLIFLRLIHRNAPTNLCRKWKINISTFLRVNSTKSILNLYSLHVDLKVFVNS